MEEAGIMQRVSPREFVSCSRHDWCTEATRSRSSNNSGEALQSPNRERLCRLDSPIRPLSSEAASI
jgi:hypothetical protein